MAERSLKVVRGFGVLVFLGVGLLLCASAHGRAGGGGGYHGGGGSSHSSSSGSHSSGSSFHSSSSSGGHSSYSSPSYSGGGYSGSYSSTSYSTTSYSYRIGSSSSGSACCCFSFFLLMVVGIAYPFYRQMRGRRVSALPGFDVSGALAILRAHDPAFDEAVFLGRVRTAFMKIQAAWCAQDLSTIRPFISDGVSERFSLQFIEQRAEGYRDHMDDLRISDVRIAAVSSPGVFDELTVRITAAARDWRQALSDGSRIDGSTSLESFTEFWTFLRRRGAVSDNSRAGLIEGQCPNCGTPIELNQSANCVSCKALLRSGTFDWVLAEITQAAEWRPRMVENLPGVAQLRASDADFDIAALEDRASVIYWRKATTDRTGRMDALAKSALPQFAWSYGAMLVPPTVARAFVADTAVGSVDTLGVFSAEGWDHALIEIKWSGHGFTSDPSGGLARTGQSTWAATLFVLTRRSGVSSNAGLGIASAHCPACGAPESISASAACEFCGVVLNDGSHGWVVEEIRDRDDPAAQQWIARMMAG